MSLGIAQIFLEKNFEVILYSRDNERLIEFKKKLMKVFIEKAKYTKEISELLMEKLFCTTDLLEAKSADLVIEAIVEDIDIKKELFKKLDEICKKNVIFSTNTSSLSITEIAAVTSRPEKFIGMHFFNPASLMKLVEVIKGIFTSDETIDKIKEIIFKLKKEHIIVEEIPGFLVNRILIPMINDSINLLEQKVATKEDIDKAMKFGANHPIGPLQLSDLIGNDVVLGIMNTLYRETKDNKYRPSYLLKKYVSSGLLGRKVKKGFYTY